MFEHELGNILSPNSSKLKLKTITEIKNAGLEVIKIIINSNLTESEAFASEAALINVFNYMEGSELTNIVSGHHTSGVWTVEEFEREYGAIELSDVDIRHKILVIKINQLYYRGIDENALYDAVRGIWRASLERVKTVDYVFGVYNSLIVAVYKPTQWFVCKNARDKLPRQDEVLTPEKENRVFFVDECFEKKEPMDENVQHYLYKSIAGLKYNQSAQNPITYLNPIV